MQTFETEKSDLIYSLEQERLSTLMPMGERQQFGNNRKPLKSWETKKDERRTNYNKNVAIHNQQVDKVKRLSITTDSKAEVYQIESKLTALNSLKNVVHLREMIYNTEHDLLKLLQKVDNTRRLQNFNKMKALNEFKNLQAKMQIACVLGNRIGYVYDRKIINIEKINGKQANDIFEGKKHVKVTTGHRDGLDYVTVHHGRSK